MQFQAGNSGRPPGSKNKRTIVRDALTEVFEDGEKGFWLAVAEQAKDGDTQSQTMLANRLVPALKPETPYSLLDHLPEHPLEAAKELLKQATTGELSPEQLTTLISAITNTLRINEATVLEERITALEKRQR